MNSKTTITSTNNLQQFLELHLRQGEHYAGIMLNTPKPYHVVLMAEQLESCDWDQAMAWGMIPSFCEHSMLSANLAHVLGDKRFWCSETSDEDTNIAGVHYVKTGLNDFREKHGDPGSACSIRRIYLN